MKRGVTLMELIIALLVLSLALVSLFRLTSSAHRVTMDTYFEFLAVQLAQEPLEVFRAVGFPRCLQVSDYPAGRQELAGTGGLDYPAEASLFVREITFKDKHGTASANSGDPFVQAIVTVYPLPQGKATTWTAQAKQGVSLSALIPRSR